MLLLLGCPVLCSMCCFWIHLRCGWCSRWDFALFSHSVQQGCETWLELLFCLHISFPKPVSGGESSGLSCNCTATFNMKDRLLVFWTELSVAVLWKRSISSHFWLWCEMKLVWGRCGQSLLVWNLKSWRVMWGPGLCFFGGLSCSSSFVALCACGTKCWGTA